jgi:hypothetical protein
MITFNHVVFVFNLPVLKAWWTFFLHYLKFFHENNMLIWYYVSKKDKNQWYSHVGRLHDTDKTIVHLLSHKFHQYAMSSAL